MLPNHCTPFRHASDALKWQESTRKPCAVPRYANPYSAQAAEECPCAGNLSGKLSGKACNVRGGLSAPCCGPAPRYGPGPAGNGAR